MVYESCVSSAHYHTVYISRLDMKIPLMQYIILHNNAYLSQSLHFYISPKSSGWVNFSKRQNLLHYSETNAAF